MRRFIVLSGFLLLAVAAHAADPQFRIGPRVGPGEIRLDAGEQIGEDSIDERTREDTVGLGGTFEYVAPFNIIVEAGLFRSGSSDLFDSDDYRLTEYFGSIGYQFELGRGFSIIPRVGRARWKLEADERWFFDDDDDPPTIRGYQNYWELTALKRINPRFTLGISHRQNGYDFGHVRSTVFTAMFDL
jgi:hypothetical protein